MLFRSFGKALSLIWEDHDAIGLMEAGQQAGLIAQAKMRFGVLVFFAIFK